MSANLIMIGTKYECKHRNVPLDEIRPEMRVRNSKRDFRLHSYLVSIENICTHIWSLSNQS